MILKRGMRGVAVKLIQKRLHLLTDGIFGPLTEEAVMQFQEANGLKPDGIVGPRTWRMLSGMLLPTSKRRISEIIVHCTATPEGKDYTVEDITQWHLQRGFSTIGYHYVIYRDGSIHTGRDINIAGAHCTGHNVQSVGVCYVGGLTKGGKRAKDTRTEKQREALLALLISLKMKYPDASIHGHRDFANKACPSFDATEEYNGL